MTVPTNDSREQYQGNGATTVFPYAFKIFEDSDLEVYLSDENGVQTLLTLGTDYTVSDAGNEDGGNVTYPVSGDPLEDGETLTILRVIDITQETDLRNQGAYFPEVIEDEFDRSRMIDQQLQEQSDRSLKQTETGDRWDGRGLPARNFSMSESPQITDLPTISWVTEYVSRIEEGLTGDISTFTITDRVTAAQRELGDWVSGIDFAFPTMSAMKADENLLAGSIAKTCWYDNIAAGGGAHYYIVPAGTGDADDALYTDLPGSGLQARLIVNGPVLVTQMGALGDGVSDDTTAIKDALSTGLSVHAPKPPSRYIVSELLYPVADGQRFTGDGIDQVIIQNTINDQPLFCFGNPEDADGAVQWAYVDGIHLRGKEDGNTLWGVFCPNAPTTDSGKYEGVSTNAGNFYAGNGLLAFADWTRAARGNQIGKIRVSEVDGGYAMHVSAWGFSVDDAQLFSGSRGLRNCGASNSNNYRDLYISTMEKEGLIHPDSTSSVPTATSYGNIIVQQCGVDDSGFGSVVFRKGQGTTIENIYLERNDERGSDTDVFVGVSEIGCNINTIRHRTETGAVGQTIVETQGQGTKVGVVVYAEDIAYAIHVTGSDTRTETVISGPVMSVGATAAQGEIVDDSANGRTTISLGETDFGFSLNKFNKFFRSGSKVGVRQGASTGNHLSLESRGDIIFSADYTDSTTGGDFIWEHNGEDGNGDRLLFLDSSNGHFSPGTDGAQNCGLPNSKWNTFYGLNGTINTSDEREKTPIEELSDAERRVALAVKNLIGKYKWLSAVEEEGDDARWHFGAGAQSIMEAFEAEGLDGMAYGCLCYDSWPASPAVYDEDGNLKKKAVEAGDSYGVRPSELMFFILAAM